MPHAQGRCWRHQALVPATTLAPREPNPCLGVTRPRARLRGTMLEEPQSHPSACTADLQDVTLQHISRDHEARPRDSLLLCTLQ